METAAPPLPQGPPDITFTCSHCSSPLVVDAAAEGMTYVYRLALAYNGYTTAYRQTTGPVQVALKAPAQLTATAKPSGIGLSWVNNSAVASQVIVRRFADNNGTDLASLASGATTYADANPPLGTYTYAVVAKAASGA